MAEYLDMYRKHLEEVQKVNKKVTVILDTTEEETDWLKKKKRKKVEFYNVVEEEKRMDKIFKIGLLVLGFGYLAYLFCPASNQAGRYSFHQGESTVSVLDTTSADVYSFGGIGGKIALVKLNVRTGKMAKVKTVADTKKTNKLDRIVPGGKIMTLEEFEKQSKEAE